MKIILLILVVICLIFTPVFLKSKASYVALPPPPELTTQEKIVKHASDYGVDSGIMLSIASAESKFKNVPNYLYTDENGRYTAYGIFQITRTTWKAFCDDNNSLEQRSNVDKNIECAMKIASKSGYHHWDESKYAWGN